MIRNILALCAREHGHQAMYASLQQALSLYSASHPAWDNIVTEAERQGVAPLLYKHIDALDFALPDNIKRVLQALHLRSRRSNTIRNAAIGEILAAFRQEDINLLLVKGIALSNIVYDSPGYRPMRDIDLLTDKEDLVQAEKVLLDLGYRPDNLHDIPSDYYHLVPMIKKIDGLEVSIEVHHNLLPFHAQYPLWPYGKSSESAISFQIDGNEAHTLSHEDSLWYGYLHSFRAPLTYEEFRLIHVADIVNIVEKFIDSITWEELFKDHPVLRTLIASIHHLTPWREQELALLELDVSTRPSRPGLPYRGWPQRRLKTVTRSQLPVLARETLWPSEWWVKIYYGARGWPSYLKARFIEHPRMLWRWIKAYWHLHYAKMRE